MAVIADPGSVDRPRVSVFHSRLGLAMIWCWFPVNTLQITYEVTWEHFNPEEEVVSTDWCWDRFKAKALEDQISMPAAFNEPGDVWNPCVRKKSNSLRIIFRRGLTWSPEDEGPVAAVLFGPLASIQLRTTLADPISQIVEGLTSLYGGRYHIVEEVATREWALVAAFGSDSIAGAIPTFYRFSLPKVTPQQIKAIHARLLETAARTQNYDRGLDKFVRKYKNLEAMSATVAIQRGWQGDVGWAIFMKQGSKRCLLPDTTYGLSDDETIWTALTCWAAFKPNEGQPRKYPGRLYYPAPSTHVVEKYWNHLFDLPSHEDFAKESDVSKDRMAIFSQALRTMKKTKNWHPQVDAEAPEKGLRIAQEAAVSRVHLIADGPNQWEVCRGGTVGFGSLSLPMVGTELVSGTGSTEGCGHDGPPSHTGDAFSLEG
jgi:hypothetical protein